MNNKKIILILSGGMDSSTLLYYLLDKGYQVEAVSFNYGQKHKKELEYAYNLCKELNVPYNVIDLSIIKNLLKSSLTTKEQKVPEGHYEAESMKLTIVPHRNLMMLTIASAIGLSRGINEVAYAAHAGDHFIYPDCRPVFSSIVESVLRVSMDDFNIKVITPFMNIDKTDILSIGLRLKISYEKTWTCYNGRELACGKCGACQERLEAFKKNGISDPLKYEVISSIIKVKYTAA